MLEDGFQGTKNDSCIVLLGSRRGHDALGSIRDVTTATASSVFSSNYEPFGHSYGLTETLSIFDFEYTHKPYDSSTGLYYFGARFYDPAIERFVTEDTSKGSLTDPISLNKYAYARDNPEAIVDLTGHGWWSNLTSAVSNVASGVSSTLTSAATTVTNDWNSLPPQDQAIALTVGIDVAAGLAIAADALSIGAATPLVDPLVGAAISATSYTISSGRNARWQGVAGSAVAGAVTLGIGGAASGGVSALTSVGINAGASVGGNLLGADVTAAFSGNTPQVSAIDIALDAGLAGAAAGSGIGNEIVGRLNIGEPATQLGDYGNLYASTPNAIDSHIAPAIDYTIGSVISHTFYPVLDQGVEPMGFPYRTW
jgi:RHS repeat-associated protein